MTDAAQESPPGEGSKLSLWLLTGVCALPVAVAAALYLSGWRPAVAAAHGVLVQPPLPVAQLVLGYSAGKTVRLGDFRDKWTLLYFGPADCPADCVHSLSSMRQVHIAQGRERGRVQRVFVARGMLLPGAEENFIRAFPGMSLVASGDAYLSGAPDDWTAGGRIFLIDPLGNRVMDYPAAADPNGIRKDLARLLAYSWVG